MLKGFTVGKEKGVRVVPKENILKSVPENYSNAIVSTKLATTFVYTYGFDSNEIDFYSYLSNFES